MKKALAALCVVAVLAFANATSVFAAGFAFENAEAQCIDGGVVMPMNILPIPRDTPTPD